MHRIAFALLATSALGACASNTGIETTETNLPVARLVATPMAQAPTQQPQVLRSSRPVPTVRGTAAVRQANKDSVVWPTDASMRGNTWVIEDADPTMTYALPLEMGHVTIIELPRGVVYKQPVGGPHPDDVSIVNTHLGDRHGVVIKPKRRISGNMILATSAGGFPFKLVTTKNSGINRIDMRMQGTLQRPSQTAMPSPQGDFTQLVMVTPDGGPLPSFAEGASVWADSYSMNVCWPKPMPHTPILRAGGRGEQQVTYRMLEDADTRCLVTSRRVTIAELRVDQRSVLIRPTVEEVESFQPTPSAPNAWQKAEAVEPQGSPFSMAGGSNNVLVVVPQQGGTMPAGSAPFTLPQAWPPVPAATEEPAQPKTGTKSPTEEWVQL